jgi:hypothetical protein
VALLYKASAQKVEQLLSQTKLKPALHWGLNPVVALGLIQYKDSDLGAYNEMILSIPAVLDSQPSNWRNWLNLYAKNQNLRVGQHIIHIPVTTQVSVDAGQQLWGYPKTVQSIDHNFLDNQISSRLYNPAGKSILELQGSMGIGIPTPNMNLLTYSYLNDVLVKTTVDVHSPMYWHPFANLRISIKDTSDPICRDILELGIHTQKPLFALQSPRFSADFNSPEIIDQE